MNAMTRPHWRAARLLTLRAEMKQIWREGGMSDRELFDMVNMLAAQCSPEQEDAKKWLLTIASDLDQAGPDADAFRGCLVPTALESRLERVA